MTRIVYLHGNGTLHWSFGWAPDLQANLIGLGYDTFFETLPDSVLAREEYWLAFLEQHVQAGRNDILVGWSSGAVAAMRYAESHQIAGSVLVSPSCTDLGLESERISGYFDRPWDWEAISRNQAAVHLVTSRDDPYIPQEEFETIARALRPQHLHLGSGGHFTDRSKFAEVLDCVRAIAPPH